MDLSKQLPEGAVEQSLYYFLKNLRMACSMKFGWLVHLPKQLYPKKIKWSENCKIVLEQLSLSWYIIIRIFIKFLSISSQFYPVSKIIKSRGLNSYPLPHIKLGAKNVLFIVLH